MRSDTRDSITTRTGPLTGESLDLVDRSLPRSLQPTRPPSRKPVGGSDDLLADSEMASIVPRLVDDDQLAAEPMLGQARA
jgi:hypothetical protein